MRPVFRVLFTIVCAWAILATSEKRQPVTGKVDRNCSEEYVDTYGADECDTFGPVDDYYDGVCSLQVIATLNEKFGNFCGDVLPLGPSGFDKQFPHRSDQHLSFYIPAADAMGFVVNPKMKNVTVRLKEELPDSDENEQQENKSVFEEVVWQPLVHEDLVSVGLPPSGVFSVDFSKLAIEETGQQVFLIVTGEFEGRFIEFDIPLYVSPGNTGTDSDSEPVPFVLNNVWHIMSSERAVRDIPSDLNRSQLILEFTSPIANSNIEENFEVNEGELIAKVNKSSTVVFLTIENPGSSIEIRLKESIVDAQNNEAILQSELALPTGVTIEGIDHDED